MLALSQLILDKYQVRKTYKQKTAFINLLQEHYPDMLIQDKKSKLLNSRNLIFGDPKTAKYVFSAHYDTCVRLPFPNLITPKNFFTLVLYQLVLAFIILAAIQVIAYIFNTILNIDLSLSILLALAIVLLFTMFGFANKHNANDNTSGVITMLELMNKLGINEDIAYVLFDNEEVGLLGSEYFKKSYPLTDSLLINFDCVSDGDYLLMVFNKKSSAYLDQFKATFKENYNKQILFESKFVFYPSDNLNFKNSIGVAFLNRSKLTKIHYLSKIHTDKDRVFDYNNIKLLIDNFTNFIITKEKADSE